MDVDPISRAALVMALAGCCQVTHALPLIHEIFYDAPGADASQVFTEISGPGGFELDGWTLLGINGANGSVYRSVSLAGAVIPADGLLLIATADANDSLAVLQDVIANVDWQNGPDAVHLVDPLGVVVDALQYGMALGFAAGEGNPAPDVPPGTALSRNSTSDDSDNNARDFRAATPTPGTGFAPTPGVGVTEPGSAPLLLSALLIIGVWADRRRRRLAGVGESRLGFSSTGTRLALSHEPRLPAATSPPLLAAT